MDAFRRTGKEVPLSPTFHVCPEERIVSVTFSKHLSIRDVEAYVAALRVDPLFDSSFSEIVDLTRVEDFRISPEHTLMLADIVDPFSADVRRAFVARTEPQIHAARMHQVLRNNHEGIRIFSSIADAKKWIKG